MYKTVAEMAENTRNLLVAKEKERGTMTDGEIASLFKVHVADVPNIKEPEIVPVKNLVRWNDARLDGKWD